MMKHHKFYKEPDGRWYIHLPTWLGEKDELEMVMGADTMLDILSEGENTKTLLLDDVDFSHSQYVLKRQNEEFEGCWYEISGMNITPFRLWLCSVTKFVMGGYTKNIYLR